MTTIAITGASGQLGRLTIEDLLRAGTPASDIVAIVRDPAKVSDFAGRGVQVRQGDYTDAASWPAALAGVDRLLLISVSGPGASEQHATVIDAAVTAGVKHLLYTSVLHADTSSNMLAVEHLKTEKLIAASGLPASLLRNGYYFEIFTNFPLRVPAFIASGTVTAATGDGRVSGAPAADYAAAAAALLRADTLQPRTYELGGSESFSMADLAAALTEVTGTTVTHTNLTSEQYIEHMRSAGLDEGYSAAFAAGEASIAAGDMQTDSTAMAELIGRKTTPLTEFLRKVL